MEPAARDDTPAVAPALGRQTGSALVWKAVELGGTRAFALLRTVVLARLLAPAEFGVLAVGVVVTDLLVIVTDFGTVQALVQLDRPTRRHEAAAWTVGLVRGAAIAVALVVAAPSLAGAVGQPDAAPVIRLLALRPLVDALCSIRTAELTRQLRFRPLALRTLPGAAVEVVVAIALAPLLGVEGVALGALVGAAVATALSYRVAPWRPRLEFGRSAVRPLVRFGRWFLVASAVWAAGDALLHAIISRRLGAAELGVYFLAARVALLPAALVNAVAETVTFSLHARLRATNDPRAPQAFAAAVRGIAAVLVPVYALLAVLAPSLVDHVLGVRWAAAVPVIRLLAVVGAICAVAIVALPMLQARGRARDAAALSALRAAVLVGLVWLLTPYGVIGAAAAVVGAEIALQSGAALAAHRALAGSFGGVGRAVTAIAIAAGAAAAVALTADRTLPGLLGLAVAVAVAVAIAGAVLSAFDRRFHLGLRDDAAALFTLRWVTARRKARVYDSPDA